jgi:kinetochore protein Nuf2
MLERIKSEYEKVDVERKDNDREVESLREEAREIEAKMAENLKQNEAELNDLLAVFWKLRHEADVYMDLLANELELDVPPQ